jgi:hypothetical protein
MCSIEGKMTEPKIKQMIPADGWYAVFENGEHLRLIGWALVDEKYIQENHKFFMGLPIVGILQNRANFINLAIEDTEFKEYQFLGK